MDSLISKIYARLKKATNQKKKVDSREEYWNNYCSINLSAPECKIYDV